MGICYKCHQAHSGIGLCSACLSQRGEQKRHEIADYQRRKSPGSAIFGFAENKILLFAYLAAPILILIVIWPKIFPSSAKFNAANGYFEVSNETKTAMLKYAYEEKAAIKGYVLDYNRHAGAISDGGVLMQLHYLNEESYAQFKAQFGNRKSCPAGFYNNHIKHLFVLSADQKCKSKLNSVNLDNWGEFNITGHYAQFTEGHNESGKVSMASGNYRFFVAENCP